MRTTFFILMMLFSMQVAFIPRATATVHHDGTLIKTIELQGFELGDKQQFIKLFKPYRNKYLTATDMDALLQKVQFIYTSEGYQELVSITYKVDRHRLIFSVLMAS